MPHRRESLYWESIITQEIYRLSPGYKSYTGRTPEPVAQTPTAASTPPPMTSLDRHHDTASAHSYYSHMKQTG